MATGVRGGAGGELGDSGSAGGDGGGGGGGDGGGGLVGGPAQLRQHFEKNASRAQRSAFAFSLQVVILSTHTSAARCGAAMRRTSTRIVVLAAGGGRSCTFSTGDLGCVSVTMVRVATMVRGVP